MPRFSVVIACYNAVTTLPETLASLQAQSITDWEAICVDDGSSDATFHLLKRAEKADGRIRVLTQANAGPSKARNLGVAQASGEWIAFLDADDLWLPDKLAVVSDVIRQTPDANAVYGKIAFFKDSTAQDTTISTVKDGPTSLIDLLGENPVCTLSNLVVKRDIFQRLGGFDSDMRHSEDLEFLIRLVAAGFSLVGTNTLLMRYRASDDGLSANLMRMHAGWRQAILSAGASVTPQQRARAEALHLRYLARRALRLGMPGTTAAQIAWKGFQLAPLTFVGDRHRGAATLLCSLAAPLLPPTILRKLFA